MVLFKQLSSLPLTHSLLKPPIIAQLREAESNRVYSL